MTKVAVIIPFFQRGSGILSRALASIAAQDLPTGVSVNVIVVDDASPEPAVVAHRGRVWRCDEAPLPGIISHVLTRKALRLRVIEQS